MRNVLAAAALLLAVTSSVSADLPAVPKQFQGTWVCNTAPATTTIGADTVSFGSPLKLISIVPGDEELNTIIVKWTPPNSAAVVVAIWKLVKLNGRQFLMDINEESPTSASLCVKKRQ
jgi:hypothetical protein